MCFQIGEDLPVSFRIKFEICVIIVKKNQKPRTIRNL